MMFQHASRHFHGLNEFPLEAFRKRKGYHWFVVATVCIGAFMAALDASIVNIALPSLQHQFQVTMSEVEWTSLAYLLTLATFIVTFGRIADMIGRRWMYACGFLVFMVSSLMCGLADGFTFLLISRVFQAVGAAMLQANSVSIITAITPAADRGKAIGIQASAQGIGLCLGPVIGGALISLFDWRWLFFVNIPIGLIGTTLAILLLPRDVVVRKRERFDFGGFILLTPTLVSIIYVLNMGLSQGWTSPIIVNCYIILTLGLTAFVLLERSHTSPMVDLTLFKNSIFTYGNLSGMMSYIVMYAVLLLTPFFIESMMHMSILSAGMFLMLVPLGMTLVTPFSGAMADRLGVRFPTMLGMGLATLGCILLALAGGFGMLYFLISGLFLVGIGLGSFTPPNNSSVMGSVPSERLGVAGGILNMSRTFGMGIGVTLGGLTYQSFLAMNRTLYPSQSYDMILAYRYSFLAISIIGAASFLISALRKHDVMRYPDYFFGDGI
jgi:EmrB/QacA subfamily drug resistance transporter